jgi:hypothetical protein
VVDCPALMRAVTESSPFLVGLLSVMTVMLGRELGLTARAREWHRARIPGQVVHTGAPATRLGMLRG